MSFVKNLASDLMSLEINTIIRSNMSGAKMPASKRKVLLQLADMYRAKLLEYKNEALANFNIDIDPSMTVFRWHFGGMFSFKEIDELSTAGEALLLGYVKEMPEGELKYAFYSKIRMMERIRETSHRIVEMFESRMREYQDQMGTEFFRADYTPMEFAPGDVSTFYPSHRESSGWNNDVSEVDLFKVSEMEITPDEVAMLHKALELGTAQIMMQTIIQLDGDVTSYISRNFLDSPKSVQQTLMAMHNDATATATGFWNHLFDALVKLAGQSIESMFSKKKK